MKYTGAAADTEGADAGGKKDRGLFSPLIQTGYTGQGAKYEKENYPSDRDDTCIYTCCYRIRF